MVDAKPIDIDPRVHAHALMALDAAVYGSPHPPWMYVSTVPVHEQIGRYLDGLGVTDE